MSKWLAALLAVLRLAVLVLERWGRETLADPRQIAWAAGFNAYRW